MSEENNRIHDAIHRAVEILEEQIENGIIIVTGVENDGTSKYVKQWGNGFAVSGAMKRELKERDAFENMELDEATGYCPHQEEDED
jgi:hypothetical protein